MNKLYFKHTAVVPLSLVVGLHEEFVEKYSQNAFMLCKLQEECKRDGKQDEELQQSVRSSLKMCAFEDALSNAAHAMTGMIILVDMVDKQLTDCVAALAHCEKDAAQDIFVEVEKKADYDAANCGFLLEISVRECKGTEGRFCLIPLVTVSYYHWDAESGDILTRKSDVIFKSKIKELSFDKEPMFVADYDLGEYGKGVGNIDIPIGAIVRRSTERKNYE